MTGERRRLVLFILTGGFAAGVNVLVRILLSYIMNFQLAVFVAYLIAMLVAYALSRKFVFEASGRSVSEELTKFAIVNVFAVAQVWLVTMALRYYILPTIGWMYHPELVSHMIGVASPVFTSYLGHKYFSFRAKPAGPGDAG
jgi:putative flippase GtrA